MGDWPPFRLPLLRRRRLSDGCSGGAGTASAPALALPRPGLRSLEELEGRREDGAPAAATDAVEAAEGREVKQMKSSVPPPPPPPPRSRCLLRRMRGKRVGG